MSDGSLFQVYELPVRPDQRLRLRASSEDFDPVLYLVDAAGRPLLVNDDEDPKTGDSAGLDTYPLVPGAQRIWVNAFSGGGGAYELDLEIEDHAEGDRTLEPESVAVGWLTPADAAGSPGGPVDRWRLLMPAVPTLVWLEAMEFDPRLSLATAGGREVLVSSDVDPIGGDVRARLLVVPGPGRQASSPVTVEVTSEGQGNAFGEYRLWLTPLPLDRRPELSLRLRPLFVTCDGDLGDSDPQWLEWLRAVERSNAIYAPCGIRVELEDRGERMVCLPEIGSVVQVDAGSWTHDEELLQAVAERTGPPGTVLTVFVVAATDGGERHAIAYPMTRYAPRRAAVIIGRNGLGPARRATLAHEIGHVLGLGHSVRDDGDAANDAPLNLMYVDGDPARPDTELAELSALQCAVARGAPHWLTGVAGRARLPRTDRLLTPGESRSESLSEGDPTHAEGRRIDVFYFFGRPGERLTLEAVSSELDPILLVDGPSGERLAVDDDSGGGRSARIELTLTAEGDYSVGVTSALPGESGRYRLAVSAAPVRAAAE